MTIQENLFPPACIASGRALTRADGGGVDLRDAEPNSCGLGWAPATCEHPDSTWEDCPKRATIAR